MQHQTWKARFVQCGIATAVLLTGAWVHAQDTSDPVGQVRRAIEQALQGDPVGEIRGYLEGAVQRVQNPSSHWLGVTCLPASAALRSQLELPKDQGLVVIAVAPKSPAAAAGIEVNDVLLEADETVLTHVGDLVDAIEVAAEEEETLAIQLMRKGKAMSLEVEPAKRPADLAQRLSGEAEDLLSRLQEKGEAFRLDLPRPGAIVKDLRERIELPENVSITITRKGKQPAKIVVTRDDETWELTEDNLDQLPKEIRGFVDRSLGRLRVSLSPYLEQLRSRLPEAPAGDGHPAARRLKKQANRAVERTEDLLEHRLNRLTKRLEKLEKQLLENDDQEPEPNQADTQQSKPEDKDE